MKRLVIKAPSRKRPTSPSNKDLDRWVQMFNDSTAKLKESVSEEAAVMAVQVGAPHFVLESMAWERSREAAERSWGRILREIFFRSAYKEAERLKINLNFGLRNPYAEEWIRRHGTELVAEVYDNTRAGIRRIIEDAFRRSDPPYRMSQRIREIIGLTEREAKAVHNYWTRLTLEGNRSAKLVDRMTDSYSRKMLRRRAMRIARTETINAQAKGTQESWRQAREQGIVPTYAMQQWIAAKDDRVCPICRALDGQIQPVGGMFQDNVRGIQLPGPTAHPLCRCSVGLVVPD